MASSPSPTNQEYFEWLLAFSDTIKKLLLLREGKGRNSGRNKCKGGEECLIFELASPLIRELNCSRGSIAEILCLIREHPPPSTPCSMQPREEVATSSSYTVISFIPCQTAGKPRLPPKPGSSEAHSPGDSNGEN